MPKVGYSEEEREQIRKALLVAALELMAKQGIQHTTVEQIYKKVGISRTFFYTFFPTKEDLVIETLYLQQPKVIAYAKKLVSDPTLDWREAVTKFLHTCCYGEQNGIAVMTIEEQQMIFRRLTPECYHTFRRKQAELFGKLLEVFGIVADRRKIALFTNLCLSILILRRAIPETLPMLVAEAVDDTIEIQIASLVEYLENMKKEN